MLADEPVASLDPEHQLKVMAVLRALAKDGRAVVIVLHDLTLAARFCDTLFLLNKGRLADHHDFHGPQVDPQRTRCR